MSLRASETKVGDTRRQTLVEGLSRMQLVQYAGASADYTPMHTDEVFATQIAGYPSVFAPGMLTMGLTGRLVTDWVGDGRLRRFGVRFLSQLWPGDTLTGTATVQALREDGAQHVVDLEIEVTNQNGDVVLTGTATASVEP
jgi:VCBS repeat-containing protein